MHSVSPLFEAGMVWAPDTSFADEMSRGGCCVSEW